MRALFVGFMGEDPSVLEDIVVTLRLRWPSLRPYVVAEGEPGVKLVEEEAPDVVMVHSRLPDMGLLPFIRAVRDFSNVPVVVVGDANCPDLDAIKAMEQGADDYIRLPVNLMELIAKIIALLRRAGNASGNGASHPLLERGDLVINPATYEVLLGGRPITLTPTEFRLLYLLARNTNATLSHEFLKTSLWGDKVDAAPLLKKYVQRLRRKLEENPGAPRRVISVHGIGYRLNCA